MVAIMGLSPNISSRITLACGGQWLRGADREPHLLCVDPFRYVGNMTVENRSGYTAISLHRAFQRKGVEDFKEEEAI